MEDMSISDKETIMRTIQVLNSFIQKRKYSNLANDIKLVITTPIGEEFEILTAADAEACKLRMERILDMEKMLSR